MDYNFSPAFLNIIKMTQFGMVIKGSLKLLLPWQPNFLLAGFSEIEKYQ